MIMEKGDAHPATSAICAWKHQLIKCVHRSFLAHGVYRSLHGLQVGSGLRKEIPMLLTTYKYDKSDIADFLRIA